MQQDAQETEVLDAEPQEVELEVELESSEPEQPTEPVEQTDQDLENYSASVNKRISKLTAKMREAERREQAAIEYAQSVQQQLQESNQRQAQAGQNYTNEFQNRLTSQKELLSSKLKEAIDRGDSATQVEIQGQMAQLAAEESRVKLYQQQQKRAQEAYQQQPQQPQAQPQDQQPYAQQPYAQQPYAQQQQPPEPDEKAKEWTARNEWFGENEPMTLTAFSIHKSLVETEGYDPTSDEYYDEIDKRMREEFPHKFEVKKQSTSPMVAGPSRKTGQKSKKSIKLTQSQIAIARKLNVPLEQYAAQLERLNS